MRYLVSFYCKEDYRPKNYPTDSRIIGYWAINYSIRGTSMRVLVDAESYSELHEIILKEWEPTEFNSEEKPPGWTPSY
jgi:hypothetical protein